MRRRSLAVLFCMMAAAAAHAQPLGIFEGHGDIGTVVYPGDVAEFDSSSGRYTISASGANLWARSDELHFVWKKIADGSDVTLTADIEFTGVGKNPHRKGVLMIRQNLNPDGAYADAALHGDGLTSLQSREANGELTHEIQSNITAPQRIRISKRGDYFFMSVPGAKGGQPQLAGGWMQARLTGPFYVGIGVCAHDKDTVEKLVFSNVKLATAPPDPFVHPVLYSTLETLAVASTDRRVTYFSRGLLQAPSYSQDGLAVTFTANGLQQKIPASGGVPALIPAASQGPRQSFSSDGKVAVFAKGKRGKQDIYLLAQEPGAKPTRLTKGAGSNQDPVWSADGTSIYFTSTRGFGGSEGSRQIWRMKADGSGAEAVTKDPAMESWSPQPSPDGRQLAFLSAARGSKAGLGDTRPMMIQTMMLSTQAIRTLAKLLGGEGSMAAPPWSPDSRRLTFVSYQILPLVAP